MATSTTFIMKSLLVADLMQTHGMDAIDKLDNQAIDKMTVEDHILQDARVKMGNLQDRNNNVMGEFSKTGGLISDITKKVEDAFSEEFADEYNDAIHRTNNGSQGCYQNGESLEDLISKTIDNRNEFIQQAAKGGMSTEMANQTYDEKNTTLKDSTKNILDQTESIVARQEKELPSHSRLHEEAKHVGYKTRVLRAHALGDNDLKSDASSQGPAQDSGGGSSVTPG